MTQEEKAKRYDEAINAIKELKAKHPTAHVIKDWIKENFPELAESEDEEVRNKLIEFFKGYSPDEEWWGNITQEDILAWLEKQGEQEQDINIQINPSEYINDMGGNGCYLKNITQVSAWSEEDEKKRNLLIAILNVNHPNGCFKVNPIDTTDMEAMSKDELVSWLKSLKERYTWKPSDEQMDMLKIAVSTSNSIVLDSLYNDLKKLKE